MTQTLRIQKIIAQAGLASRREAESWIRQGLVRINGQVAQLGSQADPLKDAIKVKGKLLRNSKTEKKIYFAFHKPKSVIAMNHPDPEGRRSIHDYLKQLHTRVFPVGRMDYNGEGLMILTNDGNFSAKIQKCRKLPRRYRVKIKGHPNLEDLEALKKGSRIEGRLIKPAWLKVVKRLKSKTLVDLLFVGMGSLEIKILLQRKGFLVEKITRTGIGQLRLDKLPAGQLKPLKPSQIKRLLEQPEMALPQELRPSKN